MLNLPELRIINLIGSLYHAAEQADPAAWAPVYTEIADLVSSERGALNLFVKNKAEYSTVTGTFDPEFDQEYAAHFHNVNPFKNVVENMRSGERLNRQEHLKDDEFRRTEFYRDYYRKYNFFHFEHQVFLAEQGIACGISLTRSESQGNFTSDDLSVLELLTPHLQRAFKLYLNLSDVKRENGILSETLDHVPRCVVVVDPDNKLVYSNRRAQRLLDRKDGLIIDKSGRLTTSARDDGRSFKQVLDSVYLSSAEPEAARGGAMLVSRPSGLRPLQVLATPIVESQFRVDRSETLALLFISDPEELLETVDEVLTGIYRLTPAEARLASILAGGSSLEDACDLLEIRKNTARTHLKHIFAKTETNRQSELVNLILRGPASIRQSKSGV